MQGSCTVMSHTSLRALLKPAVKESQPRFKGREACFGAPLPLPFPGSSVFSLCEVFH